MLERNTEFKRIGDKIIKEKFPGLKGVRIAWLESDVEKLRNHKRTFGDCRTINKQYEWCCKYDFMITLYMPNVELLPEDKVPVLIEHELRHCGIDNEGNETKYYIIPHDVEEFDAIIEEYGLHWEVD